MTDTAHPLTMPFGVVQLAADENSCAYCGVACSGNERDFNVFAIENSRGSTDEVNGTIRLGCCPACQERKTVAASLVDGWMRRNYGSAAQHLIEATLDALAMLGKPVPDVLTPDLLDLASAGVRARFASRYSPVRKADAGRDQAAAEPWLAAPLTVRQEARRVYAHYLAGLLPARAWACPSRGCLACGVGEVESIRDPWKAVTGLSLGAGVKRSGHLCSTCWSLVQEHGTGLGPSMLRDAVLAVIDTDGRIRRRRPYLPDLSGLTSWAATARKANAEPWGHLDLEGIGHELRFGEW